MVNSKERVTNMSEFWKEYKKGLLFRIIVFAFLGMGYDVLVTTVQKIVGFKMHPNAIQSASTWNYILYGSIPLILYPILFGLKKLRVPKILNPIILLVFFYCTEFLWGYMFSKFNIKPWDYNWFTPRQWNESHGYISFHPAIALCWFVFMIFITKVDDFFRKHSSNLIT